jgi:hypothetical protein
MSSGLLSWQEGKSGSIPLLGAKVLLRRLRAFCAGRLVNREEQRSIVLELEQLNSSIRSQMGRES